MKSKLCVCVVCSAVSMWSGVRCISISGVCVCVNVGWCVYVWCENMKFGLHVLWCVCV